MTRVIAPKIKTVTIYDEAGREVTAIEIQEWIDATTFDGVDQILGLKSLKLTGSGDHLNVIDGNTFEAVLSGRRYFRNKP